MVQESFDTLSGSVEAHEKSSFELEKINKLLTQSEGRYSRMLENLKDEFMFFTHLSP